MKFILSLLFVLSTLFVNLAYSVTLVDSPDFEGDYHTTQCFFAPSNINCQDGNWYLDYIGMQYIYDQNISLYPDFTVAVLDTAIDTNHEDIDYNSVKDISDIEGRTYKYTPKKGYRNHGNLVISLFSAGKIGNGLGGRGILNVKTLFLGATSKSDLLDSQGKNLSIGYNAKTVLEGIDRLLNPSSVSISEGYTRPKIVSLSVGVSPKTEIESKGQYYL